MNTALDQVLVKNVDGPAASSHICLLKKIKQLHTHSVMDELKSARKLARNEKHPSDFFLFLPHYFRECLLTRKAWKPALCDVNENAGFSLPPNYGFYSKSTFPQRAETQKMQI